MTRVLSSRLCRQAFRWCKCLSLPKMRWWSYLWRHKEFLKSIWPEILPEISVAQLAMMAWSENRSCGIFIAQSVDALCLVIIVVYSRRVWQQCLGFASEFWRTPRIQTAFSAQQWLLCDRSGPAKLACLLPLQYNGKASLRQGDRRPVNSVKFM